MKIHVPSMLVKGIETINKQTHATVTVLAFSPAHATVTVLAFSPEHIA